MRKNFVLFVLAIHLSHVVASADEKVTYQAPCQSVDRLLQNLGPKTGLELRCGAALRNQVVSVDVSDLSRQVLLDRLAKLLGGQWSVENHIWVLRRPPALEKKLLEAELEARLQSYRSQLDQLRKKAGTGAFDEQAGMRLALASQAAMARLKSASNAEERFSGIKATDALTPQTPAARLLLKALTDDALKAVISLPPNARVVYSTNPTRVQLPLLLPPTALAAYHAEQATWLAAIERYAPVSGTRVSSLDPRYWWSEAQTEGKILLVLQRHNSEDGLQVKIVVTDGSGVIKAKATQNLDSIPDAGPPLLPLPNETASIALSSEFIGFGEALHQGDKGDTLAMPPLGRGWTMVLTDAATDPLCWAADLLRQAAKTRARQYVAVLPDSLFEWYVQLLDAKHLRPTDLLNRASSDAALTVDGEWIVVKPRYPLWEESFHIGRAPLRAFLDDIKARQSIELSSIAKYALDSPSNGWLKRFDLPLVRLMSLAVAAKGVSIDSLANSREALAFFGSLTVEAWKRLESGDKLSLQSLSQTQVDLLSSIVYTTNGLLLLRDRSNIRAAEESLQGENTELLPEGIPMSGSMSLAADNGSTTAPTTVTTYTLSFVFTDRAGYNLLIQYRRLSDRAASSR